MGASSEPARLPQSLRQLLVVAAALLLAGSVVLFSLNSDAASAGPSSSSSAEGTAARKFKIPQSAAGGLQDAAEGLASVTESAREFFADVLATPWQLPGLWPARSSGDSGQRIVPPSYSECMCSRTPAEGCGFLVPLDQLVNNPQPIPEVQAAPCILLDEWVTPEPVRPVFSVVLTVWNQAGAIGRHVQALLDLTMEPWELVVVFDGCQDDSIGAVEKTLDENRGFWPGDLQHVLLINQSTPVYETSANNIGMRAVTAGTDYIILVQDDMLMQVPGWNLLLALPMRMHSETMLATSGRCAHNKYSLWMRTVPQPSIGRCGLNINRPLNTRDEVLTCRYYIRDTANRGPLLLNATKLRALGYLDEQNFILGNDEHDLMMRAWFQHNWTAAWAPLPFEANLDIGGMRGKAVERPRSEGIFVAARNKRAGGGFKAPSTPNDHNLDIVFPREFNCSRDNPRWYLAATRLLRRERAPDGTWRWPPPPPQ